MTTRGADKTQFDFSVWKNLPNETGHFGQFGGRFVPETLMPALEQMTDAYARTRNDPQFKAELGRLLKHYVGRPTPTYFAERLSDTLGGARIYLKREDLAHTGAHKINNALGQGLLAKAMGKDRIIAETGAGQHGVAVATVCAMLDLECLIYMGEEDIRRQELNVFRMKILGAEVVPVASGSRTLKDAINEAIRDWVTNVVNTFYIFGSVAGPHPYPMIVRDFQAVIGREAREQIVELTGRLPDLLVACVGGGSNAMGLFYDFVGDTDVKMVGVEAGGTGVSSGKHAATLTAGRPGVLHGARSYLLQDENGQVHEAQSISAGLDYPGVGPEHSYLMDTGRATYLARNDDDALRALSVLAREEGIIPALETAHALAYAIDVAPSMDPNEILLINVSGRGDKDMETVVDELGLRG